MQNVQDVVLVHVPQYYIHLVHVLFYIVVPIGQAKHVIPWLLVILFIQDIHNGINDWQKTHCPVLASKYFYIVHCVQLLAEP